MPFDKIQFNKIGGPVLRKAVSALLLALGLGFVAITLRGQFAEFSAAAIAIQPWNYALITLLATLTVIITAALHAHIVGDVVATEVDAAQVRYAYAASQIARYVPGKVFGVMLEAQMLAPKVGLRAVLAATLLQTLLVYAWAASLSITIFGVVVTGSAKLALLAPLALASLWFAQRNRWLQRVRAAFAADTGTTSTISTALSRRGAARTTMLLAVQWIPFFAIWIVLAATDYGIAAACWLAASYLFASIGGALLVLIPSGLVVREAAFVWLGAFCGAPMPSLLAWAVVVRIVLTLADLLAVPVLWAARGRTSP